MNYGDATYLKSALTRVTWSSMPHQNLAEQSAAEDSTIISFIRVCFTSLSHTPLKMHSIFTKHNGSLAKFVDLEYFCNSHYLSQS